MYPHMLSPTPPKKRSEIAFVLVNQSEASSLAFKPMRSMAARVLSNSSAVFIASQYQSEAIFITDVSVIWC